MDRDELLRAMQELTASVAAGGATTAGGPSDVLTDRTASSASEQLTRLELLVQLHDLES